LANLNWSGSSVADGRSVIVASLLIPFTFSFTFSFLLSLLFFLTIRVLPTVQGHALKQHNTQFEQRNDQFVMLENQADSPIPYNMNVDEELDEEEEEEDTGKMLPPPTHEMQFRQQQQATTVITKKREDCGEVGKCNEATITDRPSATDDPDQFKLANDLYDVRGSIGSHTRGIATEENWISQVQEILKTYAGKVQKVQDHIQFEHKLIKELIKKRREIKRKQKAILLQSQLKSANEDMKVLQGQLGQVKERENEFDKLKVNLKDKVVILEAELDKLQLHDEKDDKDKAKKRTRQERFPPKRFGIRKQERGGSSQR